LKRLCQTSIATLYLLEKGKTKTTFSRAKDLAPPFLKVEKN
jgi:hypothetical protein